jgi:putative transposase
MVYIELMKPTFLFLIDFLVTWFKLLLPGGAKRMAAENAAMRKQLIKLNIDRKRASGLVESDRIAFGLLVFLIPKNRLKRSFVLIKPATILRFHKALVDKKYSKLFSSARHRSKTGPKGPSKELINFVVEMKQRNPRMGCPKIALQINHAFGLNVNKDVVRRILQKHYKPEPDGGPSWLTFIGHLKDSLWSMDLFRCYSMTLKEYWVMIIMDQHTRRIVGFSVKLGPVSGVDVCCMFNQIIAGKKRPKYLSTDNDPLFKFHRWLANLRIEDIEEIKSVPYVPTSHPFIERLIGTVRQELLDEALFCTSSDLQNKLNEFQRYYNASRVHYSLDGMTPLEKSGEISHEKLNFDNFKWQKHCRGLFQIPISA